jgi:hypothetical protein
MFFYLPFNVFRRFGKIAGKVPLLTDLSLGTDTDAQDMITSAEDEEEGEGDGDDDDDDDAGDNSAASHNRGSDAGLQLQMFKSAPKLISLECVNLSPFLFTFPWNKLTNIPIIAVTIEECLSILRQATNLEKAGFVFLTTSLSPLPSPPHIAAPVVTPTLANATPAVITGGTTTAASSRGLRSIHHPSLAQLSILTSPWDESIDLTPLFPLLSLPNLLSLTICNLKSHFGTSGFTSFLSRLYSLQTLHLRKTALSDQNLVAGLRVVPTVEKLVVHPLIEGYGPPSVTDVVFNELRWKSWVVDGEYTEFDENVVEDEEEDDDDVGGSNNDEGESQSSNGRRRINRKQRKRSNSILPLLPRLTSIEVKLDNTTADAFIHMIHSRRTSVHFPPYRYKRARSPSGEEEGEPSGLIVAAEDDEEGEDGSEGDDEEIDKPSILEHVRIRYSEPLHAQFISEFEDLQRDGLKIELDYMNENGGIEFVRHFFFPFDYRYIGELIKEVIAGRDLNSLVPGFDGFLSFYFALSF